MTKKIKDLTLGEIKEVCNKMKHCIGCPLSYLCSPEFNSTMLKTKDLEWEIEV